MVSNLAVPNRLFDFRCIAQGHGQADERFESDEAFLFETGYGGYGHSGQFGDAPARDVFLDAALAEVVGYLSGYVLGVVKLKAVQKCQYFVTNHALEVDSINILVQKKSKIPDKTKPRQKSFGAVL